MKDLTITISGDCGSGKSRMSYFLKDFLEDRGFTVEQSPDTDFPDKTEFESEMSRNLDKVISGFTETRKIKINQIQTTHR